MAQQEPADFPESKNADKTQNTVRIPKRILYLAGVAAILLFGGLLLFTLGNRKANAPSPAASSASNKNQNNKTNPPKASDPATKSGFTCSAAQTAFQDKAFGAQFCYPTNWGTATLNDAKVAAADSGHREVVRFSSNPYVIVGGMSDDWSTSVGRGVGCLEPDNVVPPLSAYDTSWHGIEGSGADVSYAVRSLPSSAGGYSVQESVSNLLVSGVCVQGHKVISGSRYRVVAVNYARDFAPASGITTPAQHMAEPNVLFSTELRTQYDAVLASLAAY